MHLRSLTYCLVAAALLGATACTDVDIQTNDVVETTAVENLVGDYSRTLIVGDFLYGVDNSNVLTYDISERSAPKLIDRTEVGLAVETVYHHEGDLFIGSRRGMYVYSIARDGVPVRRGNYQYANIPGLQVEPCDPVVAEGNTAFASLYTSTNTTDPCGRTQAFQAVVVIDVSDVDRPTLVQTHNTQTPRGLAIEDNILFVCNNENGLSVFDVSDRNNFVLLDHVSGVDAWDAIAKDNLLIVVGATKVVQYDYSNPSELVELSSTDYPRT